MRIGIGSIYYLQHTMKRHIIITSILFAVSMVAFAQRPVETREYPSLEGTINVTSYLGKTVGGTGIVYNLEFTLKEQTEYYYTGTLEINGWQTFEKLAIEAYRSTEDSSEVVAMFKRVVEGSGGFEGLHPYSQLAKFCYFTDDDEPSFEVTWYAPLKDYIGKEYKVSYNFVE